jgi:uncharacterized membrane protein
VPSLSGASLRALTAVERRCRYTLPGAWTALVFACLAFTPSLLPRPALFQGAVTGIDAAIGYGLGVLGAWVWREFADRDARRPAPRSWRVFFVTAAVALGVSLALGQWWQRQAHDLVDTDPETLIAVPIIPVVAVLVFVLLVALARALRTGYRRLAAWLDRYMGARAARALGLVTLVALVVLVLDGILWTGIIRAVDRSLAVGDLLTPDGVAEPTNGDRSGGPGSLVEWGEMGREGRVFVGRGPNADDIEAFTGEPAQDPIRIYAGVAAADTAEARAELAVRDLERAGGFERSALLVVTTTGTGWVEPSSVGSFEHLTGGDAATVSMQYSHLPSWLSFLVDQARAREAGRALYDAVYEVWIRLPADERPRLYVFGESLGSFGGETAFSGEFDLRNRTDGVLFVGPPNFNPLYRSFVDDRDRGSREVLPVYRGGRTIRFTERPRDDIEPTGEAWPTPRVLYMQHPSDPITWWSPDLVLNRPDWLEEPRGSDVLDATRWVPFVTFWQVTADLALGFSTEPGHGHNYTGEHVDGWAAVMQPDEWTAERADELRALARAGAFSTPFEATTGG